MSSTLRIVHVGLGPLGRRIAGDISSRRLGRLVAAVDVDRSLVGLSPGELGIDGPPGVRVSSDLAAAVSVGADVAVVTTSSSVAACAETFRTLLRAGLAVVSTCEELLYPWLRHRELAEELAGLARSTGGRLLGTGVNPGYLMDALPAVATAVCRDVRAVRVLRRQDASNRRGPFQRKIGATLAPDVFSARIADGSLRHVGLCESMHLLAQSLGWGVASWSETIEPVIADRELRCDLGPIARGHAAGVRQISLLAADDGRSIELDFIAAIGASDPIDRVTIEGDPDLRLEHPGGVHGDVATCAITLNAIPSLLAAPPGLHTMATIPAVRCVRGGGS